MRNVRMDAGFVSFPFSFRAFSVFKNTEHGSPLKETEKARISRDQTIHVFSLVFSC